MTGAATADAHFFLDQQDLNGPSDRFYKNLQALEVLARLEQERRPASSDEKQQLAHFTSFGESALLTRLVSSPANTLPELLAEAEVNALRRAALTAFYTPLPVVQAIWAAVARLGFDRLSTFRMLEPAAGIGNFISAMPPDLRARAQITAVELEPLSARMLGQIHPDITLHGGAGFQDVSLPDNAFDLAISNVPFGDFGVADASMHERFLHARIHDYFFAKALRLVRPGGIVAFLTSYGTLDKRDDRVRAWLADRAELLGAYRLPSGIFATNAGSYAGTDLLILRKYQIGEQPAVSDWRNTAEASLPSWSGSVHTTTGARYGDADDPLSISEYFVRHPERVIGLPYEVRRNGLLFYVVVPPAAADIATVLAQRLESTLPADVVVEAEPIPVQTAPGRDLLADDGSALDLDAVGASQRARAEAVVEVYQAAKILMRRELQDASAVELEQARHALNQTYDDFVQAYGCISTPTNRRLLTHLPELAFLQALEERPRRVNGMWAAEKAPIFHGRTLRPLPRVEDGALSVQDALVRSLDTTGRVDLPLICRLSGQPKGAVLHALGGVLFRVPSLAVEDYVTADAYLSGNVRAKLREARALATIAPDFQRHVTALEAVQPPLLGKQEIVVRLGAAWLPPEVVRAFIQQLIPVFQGAVRFHAFDASWTVVTDSAATGSVENTARWGTRRFTAIEIIQALLVNAPIIVRDVIEHADGTTTTVVNDKETAAAQEKALAIREVFGKWIWDDPTRERELVEIYNERFNALRPREYDGAHLTLPGLNTAVLRGGDLSPWQKAAVWQALQNPATLLAHAVGAGKTFTMVTVAREARRMGMANKPLLVVPNHLVGQTALEALRLFPGLSVLSLGPEDFARPRRGVVLSRIATGDWDLVIVPFTSFQFLPIDADVLHAFYDRERARLRDALEAAEADAKQAGTEARERKRAVKKIEKALERLEVRIKTALGRVKRDSERVITWRELGIDLLMIDEAHHYKNLYVPTRLTVAGAPQADSLRALDLRIKTWDLLRRGRKVVFATATPIMNTLGEAFVMQLYLQEQSLAELGIDHFDAWVSVFAEVRDMFELKPDGSGFQVKSRLNTFINLPELAQLWRTVLNVRTAEQLALPRPTLVGGKPIVVSVPASPVLRQLTQQLVARVERIKNGSVDPRVDNMLRVTSEARLAALDTRLLVGGPETPHCKINALIERVALLAHTYAPARGAQLIFCDLATPKGKRESPEPIESAETDGEAPACEVETAAEVQLNNRVYHEIRAKLVRRGLAPAEIAFIHDYPTKAKRDELFAAMNAGQIRVLIGSTHMMGTGMNVQRRLIALHHLDAPWRPGDVEQRDGRILRQGNLWPEAYIFHYVTEQSFDSYLWQLLENKARFIGQVLTGEVSARTADDIGDTVLTAAEVKAIATGNPRILERFRIENELARLERLRHAWRETRAALERKQVWARAAIADRQRAIAELHVALRAMRDHAEAAFSVTLEPHPGAGSRRSYTRRAEAGEILLAQLDHHRAAAPLQRQANNQEIGTYRGLALRIETSRFAMEPVKLVLSVAHENRAIDILTRVFAEDITPPGVFASIDAGLRELPDRIARHQNEIDENEALIAACDAELSRTATWEAEPRWQQLVTELHAITTGLTAAEPDAGQGADEQDARPEHATSHRSQTPPPQPQVAAGEIAVLPVEHSIPAAAASLALLRTLAGPMPCLDAVEAADDADLSPAIVGAPPADVTLLAGTEANEQVDTPRAPSGAPPRARASRSPLRFGDYAVIAQTRSRRTSASQSTPRVTDASLTQLPLFGSVERSTRAEQETSSSSAQQLPLL